MASKDKLIWAGLAAFRATGLHRLLAGVTRGQGVVLTFHQVRPWRPDSPAFAPNRLLEITPEFLDAALTLVRRAGFDIVALDEGLRRLGQGGARPFAVLTFDDGYRDTSAFALPVLERHAAPFTVYFATGFIERTARLWWLELEGALRRVERVDIETARFVLHAETRTGAEKSAAFDQIYWGLRPHAEQDLLDVVASLARPAEVSSAAIADALFMPWDEVLAFSQHPLVTVGAHSVTHRMLAKWPIETARAEMIDSKAALERRLGAAVRHFAYPVGDPGSAGAREFALAREIGFDSAVTTRPGMLFADHSEHRTALPRVSVNGKWQSVGVLETLLSGAPFALWNRGRRLNVA